MKRIVAVLLMVSLLFSLTACSGEGSINLFGGQSNKDELIYPDENDEAFGYMGDTLRTSFFDMRLEDAYTCYEFDGVTPDDGYKLLVATISLYNYTTYTQPMYFYDFEIYWDGDDEDSEYVEHITLFQEEVQPDESYEYYTVSDQQLPVEYDLSIKETREGILLYQVPEASKTYSVVFVEYFEDESEGALYEVRFSAPEK